MNELALSCRHERRARQGKPDRRGDRQEAPARFDRKGRNAAFPRSHAVRQPARLADRSVPSFSAPGPRGWSARSSRCSIKARCSTSAPAASASVLDAAVMEAAGAFLLPAFVLFDHGRADRLLRPELRRASSWSASRRNGIACRRAPAGRASSARATPRNSARVWRSSSRRASSPSSFSRPKSARAYRHAHSDPAGLADHLLAAATRLLARDRRRRLRARRRRSVVVAAALAARPAHEPTGRQGRAEADAGRPDGQGAAALGRARRGRASA